MLRLLESGVRPAPRAAWTFASSFAHGSIITMAVLATMQTRRPTASSPPDVSLLYVPTPALTARPAAGGPVTGVGVPMVAPRLSLPSIALPNIVGIDIDVTPRLGTIVPGNGDATTGSAAGTGLSGDGTGLAPSDVHERTQVDKTVVAARDNPRPEYPAALRGAGLAGDVLVRFVVDTSGRVERGSVAVLSSTHDLFADAVRRWLPRTRYLPAEVRGRPVRQLVQQRVTFELTR